ncbi:MAG: glycosyltransferase [Desulfovibrionaceae bacterium]
MNILFLTRDLHFGGAERQLINLANGLAGRGHAVTVAVFYAGGGLERELDRERVGFVDLRKRGRWDAPGFVARLVGCVRRVRPDIVHGYLGTPNILTALLKPFFPRTRMVWGVRASNVDFSRYDRLSRWSFRAECLLSRCADFVIANSHAGRAFVLDKGFPAARTTVIPNGLDVARFVPDPEAGRAVRAAWGVPDGAVLVGAVGRIDPMKDYPTFLRAAALLAEREKGGEGRAMRFVVVGGGPDRAVDDLRRLAGELGLGGRVVFSPPRTDLPAVYSALDLFCLASAYGEGFPNVLAEAMACGAPCAATDVGDAAVIMGDAGRAVAPGDPVALAEAMAAMLQRAGAEGEALAQAARARIVDHFTIPHLVARSESVLLALLGR